MSLAKDNSLYKLWLETIITSSCTTQTGNLHLWIRIYYFLRLLVRTLCCWWCVVGAVHGNPPPQTKSVVVRRTGEGRPWPANIGDKALHHTIAEGPPSPLPTPGDPRGVELGRAPLSPSAPIDDLSARDVCAPVFSILKYRYFRLGITGIASNGIFSVLVTRCNGIISSVFYSVFFIIL